MRALSPRSDDGLLCRTAIHKERRAAGERLNGRICRAIHLSVVERKQRLVIDGEDALERNVTHSAALKSALEDVE